MFEKDAIEELSESLQENKKQLSKLVEEYSYLSNTHKSLFSKIESTMDKVNSYYENHSDLMHGLVLRSGDVKRAYTEINELIEEHKLVLNEVNASMEKLSEKYNAPKEEIAKVVSELEKYDKLKKEIGEVEKKIREEGGDGSYLADLIEKEKKLKKTFEKSRSNLVKQMFKDFQDENSEIKKQIELNEELSDTVDKVGKAQNKLNDAIDEGTKRYEKFKKLGLSDIVNGLKSIAVAAFDKYKEVDQAGRDFGRQMGMTTKDLNKHTSSLFENYRGLAYNLGMEFKEMYKFQTNYADVTQKATMLSMEQVGAMASLTRNTSEEAVSVASKNLDVFSTSADATIEYLAKGSNRAALVGLNVKKYSEAFANNIKMASKYTFKEGINGVQKMTLLSQRLKFNMESIGSAMDKFSSLEGAIEASAKIQVLGGSFAQNFGNPLEAMAESLLDAEAFTERIINTVASKARFDKKTGEVDLSPIDKQRLKAYANALGVGYDEVFNMATQSRKSKEIERVVGEGKFSKEEVAYLSNKSQFNKETGKWELRGVDGKVVAKDIKNMSKDELNNIRQTDTYEKMLNSNVSDIKKQLIENAKNQLSLKELTTGIKEAGLLTIAKGIDKVIPDYLMAIIGAIGLSNITSVGKGVYKLGKAGFKGVKSVFKGGPKVGTKTTAYGKNGKVYRVKDGYSQNRINQLNKLNKSARYAKIGGRAVGAAGGVIIAATSAYEGYSAYKNYETNKDAILKNNNLSVNEKAKSLNEAKRERNSGYGSAVGGVVGGAAGIWAGAATGAAVGSAVPVVGTIIGAIVGGAVGLAGSYIGSKIGESVTESVDDTLKEIKTEEENKETNLNEENETVSENNSKLLDSIEVIKNASLNIARNTENIYYRFIRGGVEQGIVNNVKVGNSENKTTISVNEIKVNVGGQVRLVGENGMNSVNIDSLMNNDAFIKGIAGIIKKEVSKSPVIGKPTNPLV